MNMIFDNLKNKTLLLASQSPRRKQLLEEAGFTFIIVNTKFIEETIPKGIINADAAVFLAELKANAYISDLKANEILITADTIVCSEDTILGKPNNYDGAFKMLKSLSGKTHSVITGVNIRSVNQSISFSDKTFVKFKKMTNQEIEYYIINYKPYDKAGAYGIQEWIGLNFIEKIEGSYFNVMGLPVHLIYEHLKHF
jgi:septum formation protein